MSSLRLVDEDGKLILSMTRDEWEDVCIDLRAGIEYFRLEEPSERLMDSLA